ncbi:NifB/NifX family molybdenum-iron cluster-binding protein [Hydrogenobacter thermophilus]|uniref:NifB/NifX family molybdenum-iron cluster-binding protein n=1 Tax=Hydrogenobacter thermophilus TaxID=940 RepID=UPI0030F56D46
MSLCIPVDYEFADKISVSKHFGRADAFAIIRDDGTYELYQNPLKTVGKLKILGDSLTKKDECRRYSKTGELIDILKKQGVNKIMVKRIGDRMKKFLLDEGIAVIEAPEGIANFEEMIKLLTYTK